MPGAEHCFPQCKLFRCAKNSIQYRGKSVWCRWAEEECEIANCSYATCVKRRLLPKGICGETVKRRTTEKEMEERGVPLTRLRGKALRRMGEKELF